MAMTGIIERMIDSFCQSWQAHVFLHLDNTWAALPACEEMASSLTTNLTSLLGLALACASHDGCCSGLQDAVNRHLKHALLTLPGHHLQSSSADQFAVLDVLLRTWDVSVLLGWLAEADQGRCIMAAIATPLLETAVEVLGKETVVDQVRASLSAAVDQADPTRLNNCCQQLFDLAAALNEPVERRLQPLLRQLSSSKTSMIAIGTALEQLLPTLSARQLQVNQKLVHMSWSDVYAAGLSS